MAVVVQKHWRATQERVEKFLSDTYFTDANLRGRLYPQRASLLSLKWYRATGVISFHEAARALEGIEEEVNGTSISIGPTWSTHWFRCEMQIPEEWTGKHVRFRWDSNSEAMIWKDGDPLQGLTGSSDTSQLRTDFILTRHATGGERFVLYVEVAVNGMFGAGQGGMINPPDPDRHCSLSLSEIAVFDQEVYDLIMDLTILYDMTKHLPRESPRAYEALYTANEIVTVCDPFDKSTFQRCRAIAAKFLSEKNGDSQHTIHAMGHCHIDSAWLWPYSESIRKCARSWSSVIALMEDNPHFTFTCSQAQQLEWVKVHYPSLYEKVKVKVATGQFIPVGGTWVEMDGNVPSGESFVRQFLVGQRFFKQEFGHYCKEFWLPDTFGYSAQLPQIMNGAGIHYFLTQKLSWNLTNTFPHNSFIWEGIDGSRTLVHFPPADTYESRANVEDLLKSVEQFKDKGRSRQSMLLYGHGDGGGGPTDDMLEFLKRMQNVDGLPRVEHSTPEKFFSSLESHDSPHLCKWVGELYLELHRGTYTTQAKLKQENRAGEFLLHDVDFVTAVHFATFQDTSHAAELKARMLPLWKLFLLNQFHDVLPGTCIEMVVQDAMTYYRDVNSKANEVLSTELKTFISKMWMRTEDEQLIAVNTFCWERKEVVRLPEEGENEQGGPHGQGTKKPRLEYVQTLHDGSQVALVSCNPMAIQPLRMSEPLQSVKITQHCTGEVVLENVHLRATITSGGLLQSLVHKSSSKETIAQGRVGNQFVLFDDIPLFWDAWDVMEYHLETRKPVTTFVGGIQVLDKGPLRATVQVQLTISDHSSIIQLITLDADCPYLHFETTVCWHESHKFLKVEFPLAVRSHEATYEIQFGHIARPNHFNTSWDQARFEVCGHKWADLSEHGFGVALLNDCKYGYSTLDNVMRLSLLRSPKAPDGNADMGAHKFTYSIMPHEGTFQESGIIQEAYNFNHPMRTTKMPYLGECYSFCLVNNSAIIVDTVKMLEEDDPMAIVVRLFEAFGSHSKANLTCFFPIQAYQRCNILEEPIESTVEYADYIPLELNPFEVASFILYLKKNT